MSYIAAIAAIIGSALAAKQQSDANKQQQGLANASSFLGAQELALAREAQRQGTASKIDAQGNVVFYDPSTNAWRTQLSATGQRMQDASDRESYSRLTDDQTMGRQGRIDNYGRRQQEGQYADAEMRQLMDDQSAGGRYSPEAIAAELRLSRQGAVNEGFDQVANLYGTQMARSNGASGDASTLMRLAKARSGAMATTMGTPNIEAMQMAEGINNDRANGQMNRYNLGASRASNIDDVPFQPSNVSGMSSAIQGQGQQAALGGLQLSGGLVGQARRGMLATPLPGQNTYVPDMIAGIGELFRDQEDDIGSYLGQLNKKRNPNGTSGGASNPRTGF
jgi:hypothetical protein